MLIDLHADTPLWMHWAGYRFCHRHRPWLPAGAWLSHVDLPRMQAVNMDAQVFGLVALPMEGDGLNTIDGMIDRLEAAERESKGAFQLVRHVSQLRQARSLGARVGFLSIEGVHPLKGELERADHLLARGVVSFGLAHFHANEACRPAYGLGRRDEQGLTAFGRELVAYLGYKKALIDLTHVNRRGFFDALEVAQGPLFVSHTGVAGAHEHWRNLDDEQIRAVAERGGIIGIIFARQFVGGNNIDAVVAHILHLLKKGGEASAALGSDFDGFVVPVKGLRDITGLPALAEALRRKGVSSRVVDRVMGDNALAFLERGLG